MGGACWEKVIDDERRGSERLQLRGGFGGWRSVGPGEPLCGGIGEPTPLRAGDPRGMGAGRLECLPALPSASWGSLAPPQAPPGLWDGVGVGVGAEQGGGGGGAAGVVVKLSVCTGSQPLTRLPPCPSAVIPLKALVPPALQHSRCFFSEA